MPGSTSNLSVDEQHAAATTATAKRKEEEATVVAQAITATKHREQEPLIAAVATTCKTLDEARACERAIALTWEKEKTITHHLEQQLTTTEGIMIPQDDDGNHSVDAGSNPDAILTVHQHAQAVSLQNIRSVVTISLEPSSPDYKWWSNLVLLTLRRYDLDDHILSDVAKTSIYWAQLDSIVVTWIPGTLSSKLHKIVREPMETAHQVWLTIEAQFLDNSESRI
jgi:hypothetical protein